MNRKYAILLIIAILVLAVILGYIIYTLNNIQNNQATRSDVNMQPSNVMRNMYPQYPPAIGPVPPPRYLYDENPYYYDRPNWFDYWSTRFNRWRNGYSHDNNNYNTVHNHITVPKPEPSKHTSQPTKPILVAQTAVRPGDIVAPLPKLTTETPIMPEQVAIPNLYGSLSNPIGNSSQPLSNKVSTLVAPDVKVIMPLPSSGSISNAPPIMEGFTNYISDGMASQAIGMRRPDVQRALPLPTGYQNNSSQNVYPPWATV
jgi:hypothetical protein